jgi:hypothetical protein
VEVVDVLRALGGSARRKTLSRYVGWRALKRARTHELIRCDHGTWTLVGTSRDRRLAAELGGVRSHTSAAAHWGLELPPDVLETVRLTVPPKTHLRQRPEGLRVSYRRLEPAQVTGDVTTAVRTVVDCLRDEPLRTAFAVGDSALRAGAVDRYELATAVLGLRGPGAAVARRRLPLLDPRSANAFESCTRALLIEGGFTGFVPQVTVRGPDGAWIGRVDLADRFLRVVIESDGFETHGGRDAFVRDLVRFTSLVAAGWRPLRFTWEQVMFHPEWVLARVRATVALAGGAPPPDPRRVRPVRRAA